MSEPMSPVSSGKGPAGQPVGKVAYSEQNFGMAITVQTNGLINFIPRGAIQYPDGTTDSGIPYLINTKRDLPPPITPAKIPANPITYTSTPKEYKDALKELRNRYNLIVSQDKGGSPGNDAQTLKFIDDFLGKVENSVKGK